MQHLKLQKPLFGRLENILGKDFSSVLDAFSRDRKGSFRVNTLKSDETTMLSEFQEKGIVVEKFEKIAGVFLFDREHEYAIKGTRAFYEGKIYLQSLASMLPVLALDPKKGETILDVCAAPGSKTTQMAAMMGNEGSITALEQNQIRFDKLMYNARLQGATIVEGKKIDARAFLVRHCEARSNPEKNKESILGLDRHASLAMTEPLFDRILLDAPCSAEGRINLNNEKSYGFWTLENIKKKAALQYELLSLAVKRLEKGGTLVYSTCTLAPEENEGVISRVLREHPLLTLKPIDIGLSGEKWWKTGLRSFDGVEYGEDMKKTVRILPSQETEGFFMGKIVKK